MQVIPFYSWRIFKKKQKSSKNLYCSTVSFMFMHIHLCIHHSESKLIKLETAQQTMYWPSSPLRRPCTASFRWRIGGCGSTRLGFSPFLTWCITIWTRRRLMNTTYSPASTTLIFQSLMIQKEPFLNPHQDTSPNLYPGTMEKSTTRYFCYVFSIKKDIFSSLESAHNSFRHLDFMFQCSNAHWEYLRSLVFAWLFWDRKIAFFYPWLLSIWFN